MLDGMITKVTQEVVVSVSNISISAEIVAVEIKCHFNSKVSRLFHIVSFINIRQVVVSSCLSRSSQSSGYIRNFS